MKESRNQTLSDDVRTALYQMCRDLEETLDPQIYFENLGLDPYPWQIFVINAIKAGKKWIHITGARQAGKTFISAGMPAYVSKNEKALSLIYAPSEEQAGFSIEYAKEFINRDSNYPVLKLNSVDHIKLPNGSFIKSNTSSSKTKRGRSMPRLIIFDEAALTEDELFSTITPMLNKNPNCVVIAISTPYGKRGWFYSARKHPSWLRVEVRAPWDIVENQFLVPAEPEAQYQARMLQQGIHSFYSPRHTDREFLENELTRHSALWFRQEYLCEFVEPDDQAFGYDEIDKAFGHQDVKPLFTPIEEAPAALFSDFMIRSK